MRHSSALGQLNDETFDATAIYDLRSEHYKKPIITQPKYEDIDCAYNWHDKARKSTKGWAVLDDLILKCPNYCWIELLVIEIRSIEERNCIILFQHSSLQP